MSSSSPPSPLPFSHSKMDLPCFTSDFVSQSPELDLSITVSPSGTPVKNSPLIRGDQQGVKPTSSGSRKKTQQPVGAQKNRHHHRVPKQCVAPHAEEADHNLEALRLNSTLALKKEIQFLQGEEFNSQKAIKETLQMSERTKVLINVRTTDVVNVSRSQLLYNSLVNVDIEKDEVISQAIQERLQLAPSPCCNCNKERDSPSHLIFLTSHLMRQQPFSPEEEPAKSKLCQLPPSSRSAFELFRRQKCHESVS